MAVGKKFKNGDVVVNIDPNEDGRDLGRVIKSPPLVGKRKRAYQAAVRGAYHSCEIDVDWVICDWFNPPDIAWVKEREIRLATQAEIILYGKVKV